MYNHFSYGDLSDGSFSGGYVLQMELDQLQADPQAGTCRLGCALRLAAGQSSGFTGELTCGFRVGKQEPTTQAALTLTPGSRAELFYTQVTVPQDPEEETTVPVIGWIEAADAADGPPAMQVRGIMRITPLNAACTLGATDAYIGGTAILAVTRNNPDYHYTLSYRFGNREGYLDGAGSHSDTPVALEAPSLAFPIPDGFYEEIPNSFQAQCTLTCTTWLDATQVAEPTQTRFWVRADPSVCSPQLSATVTDSNSQTAALTADPKILVRYASTACCKPVAVAQKGASITNIWVNDQPIENGEYSFPQVETSRFHFIARDSRGLEAQWIVDAPWVSYVRLSAAVTAKRTDPVSTDVDIRVTGMGYTGSFGGGENPLTVTVTTQTGETVFLPVTIAENSYVAQGTVSGLDYTQSHVLAVTVADALDSLTRQVSIGRGVPVFDWGEKDFSFHVPVFAPVINGADRDLCRGLCENGDLCLTTGTYCLTEASVNVPVTAGALVVFGFGTGAIQLAMDTSGTGCYLRMVSDTPKPWQLVKWEDISL